MSWNGTSTGAPSWAGEDQAQAQASVGDLYIVPDPPTIAENPSIGLEGRNEVPLPTAYKDFSVDDLNATNITATNINGNPNFDASNWWRYPANGNVTATLLPVLPVPVYRRQYDITDFRNIDAGNLTATLDGTNPLGTGQVNGFRGGFNLIDCETIDVSNDNETGTVSIYAASKIAGTNGLYVEGGTTLTGGGVIHGTTIGALQVGGIDTVRIDVLPAGMLLTSATFLTVTAAGATTVTAGGVLALAGGSYIEYNTDDNRFINTTSGNDATNILVGNIYPAFTGSANLRINGGGSGRGVELGDVKSIALWTELPIATWVNSTPYTIGQKVKLGSVYYNCVVANSYTQPDIPIPNWVSASNYIAGTIVFSASLVYRCSASISGSTTPPAPSGDPNWTNLGFTTNVITQIWSVYSPYASTITGDDLSNITIGKITAPVDFVRVAGSGLQGVTQFEGLSGFNYLELVAQTGSDNSIAFLNSSAVLQAQISSNNVDGRLLIQSDTGLTINTTGVTTTDFSAGVVENVKNLTLTTDLNPTWSDIVPYALNDMVERDGFNWRSEIAGNVGNIPQALLSPWIFSSSYIIGNVRYDVGANNSYLCINNISGSSTPPSGDPTNWSFFQVGSNAEDVWYQMTAVVESNIVGDRLSSIEIGTQDFVGEAGTYLTIGQDINQVGTLDATVGSGGSVTLAGQDNATLGAITGTAAILGDSVYILTTPTTGGNILVEANDELALAAINQASLASTTGNVNITSVAADVILNGGDNLTLAGVNNVAIGSTSADVNITSEVTTNINATTGAINIGSAAETSITSGDYMNIQAQESLDIISNVSTIAITSATGVDITATANDINLTAGTGDKVIVNSILDLNNNNVIDANTITGQTALTLATLSGANLNLSPDTGGLIVANRGLNLSNNNVTNANTITGQTALSLTSTNGQLNLTAGGTGNRINVNTDTQFNNRTLFNFTGTNVGGIFGLTTQPLNLVGNQTTPAVTIRGSLTMWATATTQAPGNSISGVTTLNGRNIFTYGNFYNTATQTLGAINTATRIQMNTSANNNLITLDTTTNIGRITFTNAGVYSVSWSAYLLHGSGGTAKTVIWIRLNGTDVAGSGKIENNDSQLNETNLASTSLVSVTANQYIEFYWAADSTGVPLTATAAVAPYPAIPSFSCSINIVG